MKLDVCYIFCLHIVCDDRLTSKGTSFGIMSSNFSVIFGRPVLCKTVEYIDQIKQQLLMCTRVSKVSSLLIGKLKI